MQVDISGIYFVNHTVLIDIWIYIKHWRLNNVFVCKIRWFVEYDKTVAKWSLINNKLLIIVQKKYIETPNGYIYMSFSPTFYDERNKD